MALRNESFATPAFRGRHVATSIKLPSHTAANGAHPNRVVGDDDQHVDDESTTERTMEPLTIQSTPYPCLAATGEGICNLMLIFEKATAEPLIKMVAKFENSMAVARPSALVPNRYIVFSVAVVVGYDDGRSGPWTRRGWQPADFGFISRVLLRCLLSPEQAT